MERFDWIATSAELGKEKPELEFFTRLISLSGVPASEIVHVGDHLVNDYQGATAAGIDAIYLARDQTEVPPGLWTIRTLSELLDLEKRTLLY